MKTCNRHRLLIIDRLDIVEQMIFILNIFIYNKNVFHTMRLLTEMIHRIKESEKNGAMQLFSYLNSRHTKRNVVWCFYTKNQNSIKFFEYQFCSYKESSLNWFHSMILSLCKWRHRHNLFIFCLSRCSVNPFKRTAHVQITFYEISTT